VALAGGGVLALVLGGGGDGKRTAPTSDTTGSPATREAAVDHTAPSRTETRTTRTTRRPQEHDAQAIERAVVAFVEAAEQGDSRRACAQVVGGAGKQLPGCVTALGIDPRTVPTSDELDFRGVTVSRETGRATLSDGSTFSLERSAGRWLIAGLRA
jgi:hypothetical protein